MDRHHKSRGGSLAEMLVGLSIMAITIAVALPDLTAANRRLAMRAAAARLTWLLTSVKNRAGTIDRYTGIRFTKSQGSWTYAVYEDGNGNGVSGPDIASGIDLAVEGPAPLQRHTGSARIGFPPGGVTDPDTGLALNPGASAVGFGTLALCSFAPREGATPGTIYLTDDVTTVALRCSSAGDIRSLWFDPKTRKWLK